MPRNVGTEAHLDPVARAHAESYPLCSDLPVPFLSLDIHHQKGWCGFKDTPRQPQVLRGDKYKCLIISSHLVFVYPPTTGYTFLVVDRIGAHDFNSIYTYLGVNSWNSLGLTSK